MRKQLDLDLKQKPVKLYLGRKSITKTIIMSTGRGAFIW